MYLLFGEESISWLGRANVRTFHENTLNSHLYTLKAHNPKMYVFCPPLNRLRAKKGPAPPPPPPPLGNFADISYLKENFKPHLLRDVCTLCSGALVSDSLLHMLL